MLSLTLLYCALLWVVADFGLGDPLVWCILDLASVLCTLFSSKDLAIKMLLEGKHLLWLLEVEVSSGMPEPLHTAVQLKLETLTLCNCTLSALECITLAFLDRRQTSHTDQQLRCQPQLSSLLRP